MSTEVHLDWQGATHLIGRVFTQARGSSVSFEYDRSWLEDPASFSIDPTSLPLQRAALHAPALFGALQDCGPDRWGRLLIERAVRKHVLPQKPYQDLDYVLALDDASRIGALRFRAGPDAPFLAPRQGKLPPLVRLAALLRATEALHHDTETAQDLKFLLGEGSPLGGARPKSAVQLPDGSLGIAKFPKPDDLRDIAAGEVLALTLARRAGILTAGHQLVSSKSGGIAVITRFDRIGPQRIPFLSASSLLGMPPDQPGAYSLIADAIRQFGGNVIPDLHELWRRMVFSLLASNFDDHLRNHGFLMHQPGRWSLSPAYDLNPVPAMDRSRYNKTAITEDNGEPTPGLALAAAPRFGLKSAEAKAILQEVVTTLSDWHPTGKRLGLKAGTLSAFESAFENELMAEAKSILSRA
jgi:serine/threonine-protein kinase HipA